MIESIKRGKIRELCLNELLLNEKEDIINMSVKPDYKRTFKYNMASPSNTKVSDYDVTTSIDCQRFSVDDNIIYDIAYERYRHQRESYLLRLKSSEEQDRQTRRRHKNAQVGSKTDLDHPDNERLVTRKFLQDYIDREFNEISRFTRQRNRIHDNEHYIIGDAPFRTPD
ncbi:2245_t:CDS:2 [Funneliformis caledonium]|uniref:2245_t:CDS:1 n=1 Tax=Funneliformis caledonium TaxID=1117310 RepID=A0A9N9H5Q4_9GLOM|nr:2245_t:CDS:2 [Funneliformis caledonium]